MFQPGPNHYDLAIDGTLAPAAALALDDPSARQPEGKELYTRRQVRGKVAGDLTRESVGTASVRRVWPDEPSVGWSLPEMAFKVDGNLRLGGPTLKTYLLNDLPTTSRVRESLITMNDTYRKLQASEDQLAQADMLNAVGSWKSEETAAVGVNLKIGSLALKTDARTYATASSTVLSILRRGSYKITYRVYCTPNAGDLTLTLTVGAQTFAWQGTGLPTTLMVADTVPYEKTDDATDSVTLTNTLGTNIGDAGTLSTYFQITKLR